MSLSTAATSSTKPASRSCRAATLTLIASIAPAPCSACQRGQLLAGLAQHPGAERHDQPGALGDRDEVGRRDEAAGRVLPADQRLGAVHPAGDEVEDRLVEQVQLVPDDRVVQLAAEPGVVDHVLAHPRLEPGPGRLAGRPWPRTSRCRRCAAPRRRCRRGRPGRRRCWRAASSWCSPTRNGTAERRPGSGRRPPRPRPASSASSSTANSSPPSRAGSSVTGAVLPQPLGHLVEQLVADGVAHGVVDHLEVVDVDEQHGGRLVRVEPLGERGAEPGAVGQAGERVVQREVFQLGLLAADARAAAGRCSRRPSSWRATTQRGDQHRADDDGPLVPVSCRARDGDDQAGGGGDRERTAAAL